MSALNSKADKSVSEQLQTCGCRVLELTKNDRRFLLIGWLTGARLVSHYQLMLLIAFHNGQPGSDRRIELLGPHKEAAIAVRRSN